MDPRTDAERAYDAAIGFPDGNPDERELLLSWLDYLGGAVLRKVEGLDDEAARWTPDGRLLALIGIMVHLTNVEHRWIDGAMHGVVIVKDPAEYHPPASLRLADAVHGYRERALANNEAARRFPSTSAPCRYGERTDLRWGDR
jgi:Protein of unknown function (DUF664)